MNLAEYKFDTYEARKAAKDRIYDECGGSKAYCDTSGSGYRLYIKEECTDPGLAAKICRAMGAILIK